MTKTKTNNGTQMFWDSMNSKGLGRAQMGKSVVRFRDHQSPAQTRRQDETMKKYQRGGGK